MYLAGGSERCLPIQGCHLTRTATVRLQTRSREKYDLKFGGGIKRGDGITFLRSFAMLVAETVRNGACLFPDQFGTRDLNAACFTSAGFNAFRDEIENSRVPIIIDGHDKHYTAGIELFVPRQ